MAEDKSVKLRASCNSTDAWFHFMAGGSGDIFFLFVLFIEIIYLFHFIQVFHLFISFIDFIYSIHLFISVVELFPVFISIKLLFKTGSLFNQYIAGIDC